MVSRLANLNQESEASQISPPPDQEWLANIYIYVDVPGYLVYLVFFLPCYIFALVFSRSLPNRNSDPGSLSRVFFPASPLRMRLHCYREKASAISSLVDSHMADAVVRENTSALSSPVKSHMAHAENRHLFSTWVHLMFPRLLPSVACCNRDSTCWLK